MRRRIFIALIIFFGFMFFIKPVYSENVELLDKTAIEETVSSENNGEESISTTPKTADIIEQSATSPYQNNLKETVTPEPKQELFRVLNSFMKMMLGVIIASIIIYIMLLFIRRFYGFPNQDKTTSEAQNLKAPNNEDEALKNFLNKTQ